MLSWPMLLSFDCWFIVMPEPGEWGRRWWGWRGRENSRAARWEKQEQQTWIAWYECPLSKWEYLCHNPLVTKKFCFSCYRHNGFTQSGQRENSCQILHLGYQRCCQVLTFIPNDQCDFMWLMHCSFTVYKGVTYSYFDPQRSPHAGGAVSLLSHQQIPAFQCSCIQ